jgi:hypothetical protein
MIAAMSDAQKKKNLEGMESLINIAAHGGAIEPVTETFELARTNPLAGGWYLALECPECKRTSPIARDCSAGRLGAPFSGLGGFVVECHFCSHLVHASALAVHPVLWQ